MSIYKIEKGIPHPTFGRKALPFPNMGLWESFAFPKNKYKSVSTGAVWYGKKLQRKFSIRGLRCWGIK